VEHSRGTLVKLLDSLRPDGILRLREVVRNNNETTTTAAARVKRTSEELASTLRLTGYVAVTVVSVTPMSMELAQDLATRCWLGENVPTEQLAVVEITAKRPAYAVGAQSTLSFARKITSSTEEHARKISIWRKLANREEEEEEADNDIEDEDALLDDDDRSKPSAASLARKFKLINNK
jgi:hypothetical protein